MATQGSPLRDVVTVGAPLETVAGIPVGDLTDTFVLLSANLSSLTGVNYSNRFPTPPSAFGFLITPEADFVFDNVDPVVGGTLIGALFPESDYLEPTTGQIWPRIG